MSSGCFVAPSSYKMASSQLTEEEQEALNEMQSATGSSGMGDTRAQGDPHWLANGAEVELFDLQSAKSLNGQHAEVVGFDDDTRRYRVKLHSDGITKKVGRKNLHLLPPLIQGDHDPEVQYDSRSVTSLPLPSLAAQQDLMSGVSAQIVPVIPAKETVLQAITSIHHSVVALQQRCTARQAGMEVAGDICDVHIRLIQSVDLYLEQKELYEKANGADEEIETQGAQAMETFEKCKELYESVRSWKEMAKDECKMTMYSIQKHGVLGTLKNEIVAVGDDVVDLGNQTGDILRTSSTTVPHLMRTATGNISGAVQTGGQVAMTAASTAISRSQQNAGNMLAEQILRPVQRVWHLIVTAFVLCFILPMFALRAYAPLNSVVANLGLLYSFVCLCCPPRCARGRAGKAGLLVLWPLILVVLPISLHFWLLNASTGDSSRTLPASQSSKLLRPVAGEVSPRDDASRSGSKHASHDAPSHSQWVDALNVGNLLSGENPSHKSQDKAQAKDKETSRFARVKTPHFSDLTNAVTAGKKTDGNAFVRQPEQFSRGVWQIWYFIFGKGGQENAFVLRKPDYASQWRLRRRRITSYTAHEQQSQWFSEI